MSTQANQQNGNSSPIPWLDKAYLTKILLHYEKENITINKFKIEPATTKGENYIGEINLCNLDYDLKNLNKNKKMSFIIKSQLQNDLIAEVCEDFNVFERETQAYNVILREYEEILQEAQDSTIFGPRLIYSDSKVIVLENLKEKNYSIFDIKQGLNNEQCEIFLEKLAKFHACGLVSYEKNPEIFRYHLQGNVTEKENPLHHLYKNLMSSCIKFCKTNSDLMKYHSKLELYSESIIERICKIFTRTTELNVLNHGDAWCNNIMYQNDELGNITDVLMVDYQEGYFGSIGIDWNYFIYSSWNKHVYLNYKNKLIEYYHKVLTDTLIKLEYNNKIPTLEDVHNEIKSKSDHGLITATCLLPILINEHPDLMDTTIFLEDTEENEAKRMSILNNPKYIDFLKIYLNDFVEDNVL